MEYLASNTLDLPVFHAVALKLQQILRKNTFTVNEVIELISGDQALVSKVLRVANSPFYSGLSKISTIKDAVIRLGAREIANLMRHRNQMAGLQSRLWAPGPGGVPRRSAPRHR
jgi:HD-like signal output (HDOD) protein